jgi:hypothetical protein
MEEAYIPARNRACGLSHSNVFVLGECHCGKVGDPEVKQTLLSPVPLVINRLSTQPVKQRQWNCVPLCDVSCVIDMQVVAAIVSR